jgi:hypothetical protein
VHHDPVSERVVAKAALCHVGIGPGLELDVAVVDLTRAPELDQAVDASADGLQLHRVHGKDGALVVVGQAQEVARIPAKQDLQRNVHFHEALRLQERV